jgi:hypothetical protein
MSHHHRDYVCPECGHEREPTREEDDYWFALDELLKAAAKLDLSRHDICDDINAALDPDLPHANLTIEDVRLFWLALRAESREVRQPT